MTKQNSINPNINWVLINYPEALSECQNWSDGTKCIINNMARRILQLEEYKKDHSYHQLIKNIYLLNIFQFFRRNLHKNLTRFDFNRSSHVSIDFCHDERFGGRPIGIIDGYHFTKFSFCNSVEAVSQIENELENFKYITKSKFYEIIEKNSDEKEKTEKEKTEKELFLLRKELYISNEE